jgi:hypothetical protein
MPSTAPRMTFRGFYVRRNEICSRTTVTNLVFKDNVRYSVDVCLFGFPNVTTTISTPCDINYACEPLKESFETGIVSPDSAQEFGYCDANGTNLSQSTIDACVQCLQVSNTQEYMANCKLTVYTPVSTVTDGQ